MWTGMTWATYTLVKPPDSNICCSLRRGKQIATFVALSGEGKQIGGPICDSSSFGRQTQHHNPGHPT
jgi:hypothetical protein